MPPPFKKENPERISNFGARFRTQGGEREKGRAQIYFGILFKGKEQKRNGILGMPPTDPHTH